MCCLYSLFIIYQFIFPLESYFHPANHNVASEGLHSFVQHLCTSFVYRIHAERYNQKWESKTPVDKRLTDDEVEHFIKSLIPVTFHMLFNPFDEERRNVFNILSTIRPDLIIPPLLERLQSASESLTEPHRYIMSNLCIIFVLKLILHDLIIDKRKIT